MAEGGVRSRAVYFPGRRTDAGAAAQGAGGGSQCRVHPETGERFSGPGTRTVRAPLGRLPYFFRCGRRPFARAPDDRGRDGLDRTIRGTGGDDLLRGTSANELIICGGGDDRVFAGAGNDVVRCGPGDDEVHGDSGNDRLSGEQGDDRLFGETGDDRLDGGPRARQRARRSGRDRFVGVERRSG